LVITGFSVHDVRFPTSLTGDGTDAMNKSCDYSAAYLKLVARKETEEPLTGYGMTFTIGRGNELCRDAITTIVSTLLIGQDLETMFSDMGKTWSYLVSDPQLRWLGPETGVIHLATAAVVNGIWDLFARSRRQPLWQLLSSFTPEEFVAVIPFRYITDALTPGQALAILRANEPDKQQRIQEMLRDGYPAYTTSAGWSGYSDEKVARLVRSALAQGFNHFKLKVGVGVEDDNRRLGIMRKIIDDPNEMPKGRKMPSPETLVGKNAGPTGCVVMVRA
ncbi:enolase N-terminal domain-like protein, partial [Tilletiaria anomala UBC 951]